MQKEARRRILIRRCYLNPQSFSNFRPYFIRSAFEVVDCPPLTARGKTSTDIHLVMDVLDTLNLHLVAQVDEVLKIALAGPLPATHTGAVIAFALPIAAIRMSARLV